MSNDAKREIYIYQGAPSSAFENRQGSSHAAFFTRYLKAGMRVLDCGCGPGTITLDFAEIVAPGEVWGIDIDEGYIARAKELAAGRNLANVHFRSANIYEIPFPDETFDAVFAHAVLEHISRPLDALLEIRRVLKAGGVVGVRNADFGGHLVAPDDPLLAQTFQLMATLMERNGGHPFIGRALRGLLHQADFRAIYASAGYETHGEPEAIRSWANFLASAFSEHGILGAQMVKWQLANAEELEKLGAAWTAWSEHPGAFLARPWCDAIGWKA
jgi:ubiquinone/menaquinone biosynthesis C-methylase UbiE